MMETLRLGTAGLLAIGVSASGAPFEIAGVRLAADGGVTDNGLGLHFQLEQGVVANNPANPSIQNSNPALAETILLGAHGGKPPAAGAFDHAGVALTGASDPYTSDGDQSFDAFFSIANPSDYVLSQPTLVIGPDAVWIGRVPTSAMITTIEINFGADPSTAVPFELGGALTSIPGGSSVFARSVPIPGSSTFVDLYIATPPAPGAAGLFGIVAVAGTRRRRG